MQVKDTDGDNWLGGKTLDNAIIHENYLYIPTRIEGEKDKHIRIAAKKVERRNQYWEKLESGVFTACDICKNKGFPCFNPIFIIKCVK